VAENRDFLGRGWRFPIRIASGGGIAMSEGEEKVRQSIEIILATSPGEFSMSPEFGCGVHDLVLEANTEALHGLATQRVRDALVRDEPRIDVLDVRAHSGSDDSELIVEVDYRLRANNAVFNLVYPFFLLEGVS
jgi:phage baseplate assembly protein W